MSLGQNILNLRKKNGLSQEELGEKVNVTRQTISNWELDETSPNPEQLKLLSKALNITVDELIDNDLLLTKLKITEKQQERIRKILKGILVGFIVFLVVDIIAFVICFTGKFGPFEENKTSYVINDIDV